jgi:putative ABC transport system substrate-binding protein
MAILYHALVAADTMTRLSWWARRRREFITLIGGAATWPVRNRRTKCGALAYSRILPRAIWKRNQQWPHYTKSYANWGWVNGRNLQVDHRWAAGNPERATAFAKELVALKPDVIVAHTTPSVVAMQKQTDTIPIVFVQISDPIGTGFITNLARPDANITGFTNFESSMVGKWVECLKRWRRASRGSRFYSIRKRLHMSPDITRDKWRPLPGRSGCCHIESAIDAFGREPGGGLIVMPDSFNIVHRNQIMTLAAQHRLPLISPYRFMAQEGGLMAYGVEPVDFSAGGGIRRPHPQGHQASRSYGTSAHEVRAGYQHEDR